MIKLVYVSGTRADFGLIEDTLAALSADSDIDLTVLATGQHMDAKFGDTWKDIAASGLSLHCLLQQPLMGSGGQEMARSVAQQTAEITTALAAIKPDLLLVLGDRGEMLAGAIAALYLGIPCAHFHGGERSGTVDDQIRQAISALAHIHFPATPNAEERLVALGEMPQNIYMLGAPGLDYIHRVAPDPTIRARMGLGADSPVFTVLFHPVVQDTHLAAAQAETLIDALKQLPAEVVVFAPNSDSGSAAILDVYHHARKALAQTTGHPAQFHWITHLQRDDYLSLLATSTALVGNSSSGITEAASLGTPTVNLGDRQNMRERNPSVFDAPITGPAIAQAIAAAMRYDGPFTNVYDQGRCAEQIVSCVKQLSLDAAVLKKSFSF